MIRYHKHASGLLVLLLLLFSGGLVKGQCPYDNVQFGTSAAPTVVGSTTTLSTCLYGGEYRRVTGLVAGAIYRFATCGDSDFDTEITVYTAGGGTYLGENDDFCSTQSSVDIIYPSGGDVDVLIDQYPCVSNSICMTLTVTLIAPPNDACSNATLVSIPSSTSATTYSASADVAPYCGTNDGSGGGVWYRVVGNGNQLLASLCGSAYDTKIRVYTGSCGSLVCQTGIDDFCGVQSEVEWCSVSGTTYYILVHGFSSAVGSFTLAISDLGTTTYYRDFDGDNYGDPSITTTSCNGAPAGYVSNNTDCNDNNNTIYPTAPELCDGLDNDCDFSVDEGTAPANDVCATAAVITVGGSASGSTRCASPESQPFCGTTDGTGGAVWYQMVGNGSNVRASTCDAGSDYDTKLRVYTGPCGALTCVDGDDDDPSCGFGGTRSTVDFFAENGTTYYLLVHGFSGAYGNYTLNITCNDPCVNPTAMTSGTVYSSTVGTGCSTWSSYTSCGYSEPGNERVYTFTPSVTADYTFTGTNTSGDADFFLMSSCGPSGTNITGGCWSLGSRTLPLTGGTTYYLIADNYSNTNPAVYTITVGNPLAPVVSGIPASGCPGNPITITGSNFTGSTAVTFGGVAAASFMVNSPTSITATPSSSAVSGTIAVTNAGGTGTSAGTFTVENCANDVVITSCNTTVYDAGGSAGNYGDNVDQYIIIYPTSADQTLVIDGTYNTESVNDQIFVSSGTWDNTSPNVLYDIALSGSGTLSPFSAYGAGEPITVRLQSDASTNNTGYAFNVTCVCETPVSSTVTVTDASTCGGTDGSIDFSNTVGYSNSTIVNASFINDAVPSNMTINGNATVTGSRLRLTEAVNSQAGAAVIDNTPGYTGNTFLAFYQMYVGGGSQADGYSFSFGGAIPATPTGSEDGYGNGLIISFDTYPNGAGGYQWGGTNNPGIYLVYNGTVLAYQSGTAWRGSWTSVELYIDENGSLDLEVGDVLVFTGVSLGAGYTGADKSNWDVAFAGRTGGLTDEHSIDNINITFGNQFEYSVNGGSTWQSSTAFTGLAVGPHTPAVRYKNNATCNLSAASVNVNNPAPPTVSITGDPSICNGGTTTLSPASGGTWVSNNTGVANVGAGTGVVSTVAPGSTDFTFTSSTTNCVNTTSPVTVVADPVWNSNSFSPASGGTLCEGSPVTFSASATGGLGGSVSWVRSTTPSGSGTTVTSPDVPPSGATLYYRPQFAATGSGCNLNDGTESNLAIEVQPTADIPSYSYNCAGGTFTLNGSGSGSWSIVAGTGSLVSPLPGSVDLTSVPQGTSATVRYTVNGIDCPDATDDQVINYLTSLAAPAGGVVSTCFPNPSGGTQFWASPEGDELYIGIDPKGNNLGSTSVELPGSNAFTSPGSYWGGLGDVPSGTYNSAADPARMPAGNPACPDELFVEDVFEIDVTTQPTGNDPEILVYVPQAKWDAFVTNGNNWLDAVAGRRADYNTCYSGFPAPAAVPSTANVVVTGYHADGASLHAVTGVSLVSGASPYYAISFNTDRFSGFALHGSGGGNPLPITLVAFWGEHVDGQNQLQWETASELNASHFVVERSPDGITFADLGQVEAAGTTTEPRSYGWLDTDPFQGWTYYRLRLVDLNGTFKYSDVVALSAEQTQAGDDRYMAIVPNPFTDRFAMRFYQPVEGSYTVTITDLLGRPVQTVQGNLAAGLHDVPLDLGAYASGSYLVRVQRSDGITLLRRAIRSTD